MSQDDKNGRDKRGESASSTACEGVLELDPQGVGALRSLTRHLVARADDPFVPIDAVRKFNLRGGELLRGHTATQDRNGQRRVKLTRIETIDGVAAEKYEPPPPLNDTTAIDPHEPLRFSTKGGPKTMWVVDLFTPIGQGQRGLIVAPPRTGKTVLMQKMANAISTNHPDAYVIILLIDERPEEVTEMQRSTKAEVISSTFDEPASRHVQVAEMVIDKAKRLVEYGRDVVIFLDSITRLARAYNTEVPHSGKILTGGVDANALQKPKRFFGAARNIEEGGSLTIIGTALVDTGSKMDEVIFEEFKGTGNSELHLDRRLVDKRVWPAINIAASGTRKEELLLHEQELEKIYMLRRVLADMNPVEAVELLRNRLSKMENNRLFLMTMNLA